MRLQGKTVGYFVAQEVEDLEFWVPLMRLREEGAKVIVIGLSTQKVRGHHGLEMMPDVSIEEAPKADALDALPEAALRYILSNPIVSTVIPGMRSVRNVERNIAISDGRTLLPGQLQKLKTYRWVRDFYKRV